jgi:hypothetical protein
LQDTRDVCIFAAFARRDFNQLEWHIVWETTTVFLKTFFDPFWHFGANGN